MRKNGLLSLKHICEINLQVLLEFCNAVIHLPTNVFVHGWIMFVKDLLPNSYLSDLLTPLIMYNCKTTTIADPVLQTMLGLWQAAAQKLSVSHPWLARMVVGADEN